MPTVSNFCLDSSSDILNLTQEQKDVIALLKEQETSYSLSSWYLGVLYALNNPNNPDRFSQAANSLRELIEKLPNITSTTNIAQSCRELRSKISELLKKCKDKYPSNTEWLGYEVDKDMNTLLVHIEEYIELNKQPSRNEHLSKLIYNADPRASIFNEPILKQKIKLINDIQQSLQSITHHNKKSTIEDFTTLLNKFNSIIINTFSLATAKNQKTIEIILSKETPTKNDIDIVLKLIQLCGANYLFFIKNVNNPVWLKPLQDHKFFDNSTPETIWWHVQYLKKIAKQLPNEVITTLRNKVLPCINSKEHTHILYHICTISFEVEKLEDSLFFKKTIKNFFKANHSFAENEIIANCVRKWGNDLEKGLPAVLELIRFILAFQKDTRDKEKRELASQRKLTWDNMLQSSPYIDGYAYKKILIDSVIPLAQKHPKKIVEMLLKTTKRMVDYRTIHNIQNEDYSTIWCRKLDTLDENKTVEQVLVYTLTVVCEELYTQCPQEISWLDQELRIQKWNIFTRLRLHLYSKFPNEHTLPWICAYILDYPHYDQSVYEQEFAMCICHACKTFEKNFLSKVQIETIFKTILSGPPHTDNTDTGKENYLMQQQHFHYRQLYPFLAILPEEAFSYYNKLKETLGYEPTDNDYKQDSPTTVGRILNESPLSIDAMEAYNNIELLDYLVTWDNPHRKDDNWLIRVDHDGLASEFQTFFTKTILQSEEKFDWWIQNYKALHPIYILSIIKSFQSELENQNSRLEDIFDVCQWTLEQLDIKNDASQTNTPSDSHLSWRSARREAVELISTITTSGIVTDSKIRNRLFLILKTVCLQSDSHLDTDSCMSLHDNPIDEAINNTRSKALEAFIQYCLKIKQSSPNDSLPEFEELFTLRLDKTAECPFTRPERALIAMYISALYYINKEWLIKHKEWLLPHHDESNWFASFSSIINYTNPNFDLFILLQNDFSFALSLLPQLIVEDTYSDFINHLGQHLVIYYIYANNENSSQFCLLESFYNETYSNKTYWSSLFRFTANLFHGDKQVDKDSSVQHAIEYFEWRSKVQDEQELSAFLSLLQANLLPLAWRLHLYDKSLETRKHFGIDTLSEIRLLTTFVQSHPKLVLECFLKITKSISTEKTYFIKPEDLGLIIQIGLHSESEELQILAEQSQKNLLKRGFTVIF